MPLLMKRIAIGAGSHGLHYNYGVNRSLDYTVRKVAYTSHSRVGAYAYVRRYRGSRVGSRMTLHHLR